MEFINSIISIFTDYLVPFVLLLGVLVFVHEFGHFIVAKFFGVRVEVFSIGFGKKIFKHKKGDTEYCLSIIPLGGYVKMFGDDPTKEIPEEEKKYSFLHQPVLPRIAIVAAGPLINFFFAIFIFFVMGLMGGPTIPAQLGDLETSTYAYQSGFRPGDIVKKIDSEVILDWEHMLSIIKENPSKTLKFHLLRNDKAFSLNVTPELSENENIFETESKVGDIAGLSPASQSSLIGVSDYQSVAYLSGLRPLDVITEVNNQKIKHWRDLAPALRGAPESFSIKVDSIEGLRGGKPNIRAFNISNWSPNLDLKDTELVTLFGVESPELYILSLQSPKSFLFVKGEDPPSRKAGLKIGDRILSINNNPLKHWSEVLDFMGKYKPSMGALEFEILRDQKKLNLKMTPELNTFNTNQGARVERYTVGFSSAQANVLPDTILKKSEGVAAAGVFGISQAIYWTKFTLMTFVRLAENKVSARNISGILSIGKVAGMSFALGIYQFLKMMAIISINLFILNLLPIPVLDGGHLVFFTIEGLQGKPLSIKKMEMAQTFGMMLLLSLMLFSIFNDVTNLFSNSGF